MHPCRLDPTLGKARLAGPRTQQTIARDALEARRRKVRNITGRDLCSHTDSVGRINLAVSVCLFQRGQAGFTDR